MKKNQPIADVMTSNPITVHTKQKVSDARKAMAENKFHHVPVVSGTKLIGIISASDILGISVEGMGTDQRSMDAYIDHQFSLEKLMTKSTTTIKNTGTIRQAADILADGSFHALPVVDDKDNVVGIVTSTDLIRFLHDQY